LSIAVTDYVASMKRLPENTSLKEVLDFYTSILGLLRRERVIFAGQRAFEPLVTGIF
jgi:hypothetical protein